MRCGLIAKSCIAGGVGSTSSDTAGWQSSGLLVLFIVWRPAIDRSDEIVGVEPQYCCGANVDSLAGECSRRLKHERIFGGGELDGGLSGREKTRNQDALSILPVSLD